METGYILFYYVYWIFRGKSVSKVKTIPTTGKVMAMFFWGFKELILMEKNDQGGVLQWIRYKIKGHGYEHHLTTFENLGTELKLEKKQTEILILKVFSVHTWFYFVVLGRKREQGFIFNIIYYWIPIYSQIRLVLW